VRLHLKPGQKGTMQLLAQYGDRLVCVRYRYDATLKKRFRTAEIVVGQRDWEPPAVFANDQVVALRIAYAEADARERVKRAGGRWNPDWRVWELRYDQSVTAGLADRIVDDRASTGRMPGARDAVSCSRCRARHLPPDAAIYSRMPASVRRCLRCSRIIVSEQP
jgi:hypothetical protein